MIEPVVPKPATLKRYGLTEAEWRAMLWAQGGVCAVCEKMPKTGRFNIDHEHVYRWKHLKPDVRKKYVRGLLCWFCNKHYVGRCITLAKARSVVRFLLAHEDRRAP